MGLREVERTPGGPRLRDPDTTAWSVQIEARVAGTLDEGRLRAALDARVGDQAMEHDPLDVVECESDDMLALARSRLYRIASR